MKIRNLDELVNAVSEIFKIDISRILKGDSFISFKYEKNDILISRNKANQYLITYLWQNGWIPHSLPYKHGKSYAICVDAKSTDLHYLDLKKSQLKIAKDVFDLNYKDIKREIFDEIQTRYLRSDFYVINEGKSLITIENGNETFQNRVVRIEYNLEKQEDFMKHASKGVAYYIEYNSQRKYFKKIGGKIEYVSRDSVEDYRVKNGIKFMYDDVYIVGLGSVGSEVAKTLAEIGVKKISLVDRGVFDTSNSVRYAFTLLHEVIRAGNVVKVDHVKRIIEDQFRDINVTAFRTWSYGEMEWWSEISNKTLIIDCTASSRSAKESAKIAQMSNASLLTLFLEEDGLAMHSLFIGHKLSRFACILNKRFEECYDNKETCLSENSDKNIIKVAGCISETQIYPQISSKTGVSIAISRISKLAKEKDFTNEVYNLSTLFMKERIKPTTSGVENKGRAIINNEEYYKEI